MAIKFLNPNQNKSIPIILLFPIISGFFSAVVLLGWVFNICSLKHILPSGVDVNPMSAILLLLTSLAVFLVLKKQKSKKNKRLADIISLIVILIAGIKLSGDIFGFNFQIDTLLFEKSLKDGVTGHFYNRMAPSSAFNFMLSALSILLVNKSVLKNQYPSQYIAVFIASIGLFSIVGYLYNLSPFYNFLAFMPMSTQTAIGFILIAISLLFVHKKKGFMGEFTSPFMGGTISRKLVPATVVAQISIGALFLYVYNSFDLPVALAIGILVTCNILLGIQFVWYNAKVINRKNELLINAEKQTAEISNRLKIATNSSGVGIWDMDILTNEIVWDDQIYKLFGISPDTYESAAESKRKGVHPDDYENLQTLLKESIEGKKEYSCEFRVIWPDGSIHYIKSIGTFLKDENGKSAHFIGTKWDITPSKEAEISLREYKYFFTENNDFAGIANTKGYFDHVNFHFEKTLGYTLKELTERPFVDFIHPDDLEPTLKTYRQQVAGKEVIHFINRYKKKDGGYVWLEWNAKTNEETGKLYAIARDISEQRRAADELVRNNVFLDTVVENIPNMIFVKNAENLKYISLNRAGEEIFGFEKSEIKGKTDYDLFAKEEAESFIHQDKEIFERGAILDIEEEEIQTAKGPLWFHTKKIPVNDANGKPLYLIGISEDITERKKKDELLLNQANRLREVNDELETFSYSVSHDLRAPLRSLEGFSNALLKKYEGQLDEDGDRWLKFIGSNANRMSDLINDMLDFSKLTRTDVVKVKIDMKAIVQEIYELEKINYTDKTIEFEVGDLPPANGDASMIRQVWQNLISNAFKYSGQKEEIKVNISGKSEKGFYIYSVKDEGVGFDEKYKEKLFAVFQRLHSDTDFEGTGVGLAIANRIIKKHKGSIVATSEVNKGSEFTFTLPIEE